MSTTLRIDSFSDLNTVERGQLAVDAVVGATSIQVISSEDFVAGQIIYIGRAGFEGVEKATVLSVPTATSINLSSALKLPHAAYSDVVAVLGDRIKIYRAANVDGTPPTAASYTLLTTRTIDADQPSTYYRDTDGSSAYWYVWTYFNTTTTAETDRSEPVRGQDWDNYASLSAIRKEAGFEKSYNLADSYVDEARRQAQSEINSALAARFKTPFIPVPEEIRTLTVQLGAALLYDNWIGGRASESKLKTIRMKLQALASGDGSVTGGDGVSLDQTTSIDGNFGDQPRSFYVGQRF